jgi:hypothetical protein
VHGLERGKQCRLIVGRRRHYHIGIRVTEEGLDVVACTVLHLLGLLLGHDHAHHIGSARAALLAEAMRLAASWYGLRKGLMVCSRHPVGNPKRKV